MDSPSGAGNAWEASSSNDEVVDKKSDKTAGSGEATSEGSSQKMGEEGGECV
ncbi:hypothetical protein ccbrp13_32460 [Ktedonobacteria bacterium brp13]|nr:hypothetical protein ccbrp13_32460 [Ktedonobacteria bacterium brp13]